MRNRMCLIVIALSLLMIEGLAAQENTLRPLKDVLREGALRTALSSPPVTSDYIRPERKLTATEISEINRPATVMVIAAYNLRLTYSLPGNFRLVFLKMEANEAVQYGLIPDDNFEKLNYMLAQLSQAPGKFIVPTGVIHTENFGVAGTGSGAFITPDGYVLTNAHVVDVNKESLKEQAVLVVLDQIISSQLSGLIAEYGGSADQNLLNAAINSIVMSYLPYINLSDEVVSYTVKTGKSIESPEYELEATMVTQGRTIPGKDVAILKVKGNHFPVVAFGDDRLLKPGDPLFVMGYPATIELHETLQSGVMKEPSFTSGMMNARQQTVEGWTAIQLDAASYRGNSGGPVFNEYGEVVGILTFGSVDETKTSLVQGYNFIVPSHVIGEFVQRASISPVQGPAMAAYRSAILFQEEKPRDALRQMEIVENYNKVEWPYFTHSKLSIFAAAQNAPQALPEIIWETLTAQWYYFTPALIFGFFLLAGIAKWIFK